MKKIIQILPPIFKLSVGSTWNKPIFSDDLTGGALAEQGSIIYY